MRTEIRRMLLGRGFFVSVFLGMAGIALGASYPELNGLLKPGSFLDLMETALKSQIFLFMLPVVSVLPWADSFLEDWKGGFLKTLLPRMGRIPYVESKVLAVALGGMLAWITASGLMLLVYFLLFFPMEEQGSFPVEKLWELVWMILRTGLIGGILASLGGISGALFGSGYLAYGLPFVGYYFCVILRDRYFETAVWLYPPEWILGAARWGNREAGLWLFLMLFFTVMIGIHGGILHGKLEEL